MAKNEMLWYAGGAVAAYFAYNYLVTQLIIPDYLGLNAGYPRTQIELDQIKAAKQSTAQGIIANVTANPDSNWTTDSGINLALQLQPQPQQPNVGTPSAPTGSRHADLIVGPINTLKDQLWEAAKGQIVPNQGRAHFWAWNYYLPDTLPRLDPFTMDPDAWSGTPLGRVPQNEQEVQNTLLTLDQYWAMVSPQFAAAGLSGLQGGVNHWGMQSSVWGNRSGYIQ